MNRLSLEDAYARHADELVRYATILVSSTSAADVVADTFVALLRSRDDGWSRARDPRAFLFGAVANHARMHHREGARRREREHRFVVASASSAPGGESPMDGLASGALEGLSVQQRAVTYLTYWEDLSVAQVAAALGVSEGTVRRQLARARARLRGVLT